MAIKFTPTYTSENEMIYDLAQSSPLFNEQTFQDLLKTNKGLDYTYVLAGAADKNLSDFNFSDYNYLGSEDKFAYLLTELYQDRDENITDETGTSYNVYERNREYFNQQIENAIAEETWNSLNGFERVMNTVGGILGNTLNAVYSVFEGIIDAGALLAGGVGELFGADEQWAKDFISQDTTGTGAIQDSLNKFNKAYTYIERNAIARTINDVVTAIGQMAPLALNVALPGLGTAVYYAAMAGRNAEATIKSNPDINYGNLLLYVGASTALEYGVEMLSGKLFGGSTIDKLFGRNSSKVAGNILGRLGRDFISEGLEEAVSEIFDPMLYKWMVDPDAPLASAEDIFYAAWVGGLTGLVMTGGNVITTRNRVLTSDNRIMTKKEASSLGLTIKESFGKFKSNVLLDTISLGNELLQKDAVADLQRKYRGSDLATIQKEHSSEYESAIQENQKRDKQLVNAFSGTFGTKADSVANLLNKYQNLTLEQIQTQHAEEYKKAEERDKKRTDSTLAGLAGFNRIMSLTGEAGFKKAVDLLNYHTQTTAAAARRFISAVNTRSSSSVFNAIEEKYKRLVPGQSIQIRTDLTGIEQQFQNEISGKGLRVFFADFGAVPGSEVKKGFAIDENTVVLEKGLIEKYGLEAAWDKVIKVELVRTLQYDSGILTAQTLAELDKTYQRLMPETNMSVEKSIDEAYADDSELAQIARVQAESYAQLLLFDDISISKFYQSNTNIIKKVYNWMKSVTDKDARLARTDKRTQLKYNRLLKTMRNYRNVMAAQAGNPEDVNAARELFGLTPEQTQELIDKYLPNSSMSHIVLLRQEDSPSTTQRTAALNELQNSRPLEFRDEVLNYREIFNTEYYTPEFRDLILSRNQNLNFKDNLQEYLMNSYGFMINQGQQSLMETLDLNRVTSAKFNKFIAAASAEQSSGITTLDKIFTPDFVKRFNAPQNGNSLRNVPIQFVSVNQDQPKRVIRNDIGITVYIPTNITLDKSGIAVLKNEILTEAAYFIADAQGYPNGVSQGFVYRALDKLSEAEITKLGQLLLTNDYTNAAGTDIKSELAFAIYRITDGYYAPSIIDKKTKKGDIPDGGFKVNNNGALIGYGRFNSINLEVDAFTDLLKQQRVERVRTDSEEIAFTKTDNFKNWLKEKGFDYDTAGFSSVFFAEMQNAEQSRDRKSFENIAYRLISENAAGTEAATDLLISYLRPDNKHIKTSKDIETALNSGIYYAFGYSKYAELKNKNTPGSVSVDKAHSFNFFERNQDRLAPYFLKATNDTRLEDGLLDARKNNIPALLLKSDYDYSVSQTNDIVKQIKNRVSFDTQTVSTSIDSEGADVSVVENMADTSVLSPEEAVLQTITENMGEQTEQRILERTGSDTIKKAIEEGLNEKNPEAINIREKLRRETNREGLRKSLGMTLKEYNDYISSFGVKTREGYRKATTRLQNQVLERPDLTKAERSLLEQDIKEFKTPADFNAYDAKLEKILAREMPLSAKQPTISEEIRIATPSEQIKPSKPSTVSNHILDSFENVTTGLSEAQYFDLSDKEYAKISYKMIEDNAGVFTAINDSNYDQIRSDLQKSNAFYAPQALAIFDLYTTELKGKFSEEIQKKIENNSRKEVTISAQRMAMQAKRIEEKNPISNFIKTLNETTKYRTQVTDEMLAEYDTRLKDKEGYIETLKNQISKLEAQIDSSTNQLEKAALLQEIREISNEKLILENGTNEEIIDWLLNNMEDVERATKIQQELFKRLLDIAEESTEKDKKIGLFMYDKNGQPKSFPELRKKVYEISKKLRSFRMWSMLSSPVTWVRNWIGNQGMKGLDGATNSFERFFEGRFKQDATQLKYQETRAGKSVYDYIANTKREYIMSFVKGENVKYEITSEKAADLKDLERQKRFENANILGKAIIKAEDAVFWGLEKGPLGDRVVVFNAVVKNVGNYVASNTDLLLKNLEADLKTARSPERKALIEKALKSKNTNDIFDALSKEDLNNVVENAKDRAFQQYFKNSNWLNKTLYELGKTNPAMAEVVSWIIPFPKVAYNVLRMAYKYSPLNFINGLNQWSQLKQIQDPDYKGPVEGIERAQMIRTFSEASVGTLMMIAGAIAAALGWVDIDDDDYLGPSLVLGDVKISLSNLAPSMTTFSTAAALLWAFKNDKGLGGAVTEALNVLYDNTILGNIDNIFRYSSPEQFLQNVSINYLSQYIPSLLKLINRLSTDGVVKDKTGNYLWKLIKTLGSYIPGVSKLVPNKINPYTGENQLRTGTDNWWFNILAGLSPLEMINTAATGVEAEAQRVGANTTGLSGSFKINGDDIKVTDKDKEKYSKVRADYINAAYDELIANKTQVTIERDGKRITTTYNKLTDEEKKRVLSNMYTDATNFVKIQYWVDEDNYYIVTTIDEYNALRKQTNNSTRVLYRPNYSGSKFITKK